MRMALAGSGRSDLGECWPIHSANFCPTISYQSFGGGIQGMSRTVPSIAVLLLSMVLKVALLGRGHDHLVVIEERH